MKLYTEKQVMQAYEIGVSDGDCNEYRTSIEKLNLTATDHVPDARKEVGINKEFIPYEQALELKELGFDEECLDKYDPRFEKLSSDMQTWTSEHYSETLMILAPLYQQAFRWFRDRKLADGSICRHGNADGSYSYRWDIVYEYGVYGQRMFKQDYKTYEEAEIACLNELIEIVKNK